MRRYLSDQKPSKHQFMRRLSSVYPKKFSKSISDQLHYSGTNSDHRVWLGQGLVSSISMSFLVIILYLVYSAISGSSLSPAFLRVRVPYFIIGFLLTFIATQAIRFFSLYLKVLDRTSQVEKILPDFLSLTVSNLRAGMAPFAAFVNAARPEFGEFSSEIRLAAARAAGTDSLIDSFGEIKSAFRSSILDRIVNMFAKGMKSGAHLSKLLTSSAEEIRHIQDLRAELATSTRTYTIFLGFIVIVVMPFLLSVSNQFIAVFLSIHVGSDSGLDTSSLQNMPSFSGNISITPNEMFMVSILTLLMTNMFVSVLIGLIGRGNAVYGLKYLPIFAIASILMFFAMKTMISSMFSTFGV